MNNKKQIEILKDLKNVFEKHDLILDVDVDIVTGNDHFNVIYGRISDKNIINFYGIQLDSIDLEHKINELEEK